jgi:pimeloyl-ACP methyl ester carboxylesterase
LATAPRTPRKGPVSPLTKARRGIPNILYPGRWQLPPPIWRESRLAGEYLRLQRDPVFRGEGIEPGDGRPVLLIPGFLAGDGSLATMGDWLRRTGYGVESAGIRLNVLYSEVMLKGLTLRLVDIFGWVGEKVALIGHSRGGMLAKVISHRHPEMISQIICMGSPLADPYDIHPLTMAGVRVAQLLNTVRYGHAASVERRFLRDLEAAPRVPATSIYSRTDGIVHWEACVRPDMENIEVESSHVGLALNPDVYRAVGRLLSTRSGRRRQQRSKG